MYPISSTHTRRYPWAFAQREIKLFTRLNAKDGVSDERIRLGGQEVAYLFSLLLLIIVQGHGKTEHGYVSPHRGHFLSAFPVQTFLARTDGSGAEVEVAGSGKDRSRTPSSSKDIMHTINHVRHILEFFTSRLAFVFHSSVFFLFSLVPILSYVRGLWRKGRHDRKRWMALPMGSARWEASQSGAWGRTMSSVPLSRRDGNAVRMKAGQWAGLGRAKHGRKAKEKSR